MTRYRLSICVVLAIAAHLLLLLVHVPEKEVLAEKTIQVTLNQEAPAPEPFPVEPADPLPPPEPYQQPDEPVSPVVAQTAQVQPTPPPAPVPTKSEVEDSVSQPTTAKIYRELQRYRMDGATPKVTLEPGSSSEPRPLGYVPGQLANLDRELPELPFTDAEYEWVMYSTGIDGTVERAFDAVTKEWGFTTRYGTKVKCAWILLTVTCGWK